MVTPSLLAAAVSLALSGAGRAPVAAPHAEGPPPGHTGGFGEPTCQSCHTDSYLNDPLGTLEVTGFGPSYTPGKTYTLTVQLDVEETEAAGFQAALRVADGPGEGSPAGVPRAIDPRTVVKTSESRVLYIQHTREGSPADGRTARWTFEWTAPEAGGESVILNVAANSANGDASPFGDLIYTTELRTTPR